MIATASARSRPRAELGADEAIDFRATRFEAAAGAVDAVVDLVGGEVQNRSFAVLRPGGVLVSAVSEPDQARAADRGVRALFMLVDVTAAALMEIARLIEAGRLRTQSVRSCRSISRSWRTGCSKARRTSPARSCCA